MRRLLTRIVAILAICSLWVDPTTAMSASAFQRSVLPSTPSTEFQTQGLMLVLAGGVFYGAHQMTSDPTFPNVLALLILAGGLVIRDRSSSQHDAGQVLRPVAYAMAIGAMMVATVLGPIIGHQPWKHPGLPLQLSDAEMRWIQGSLYAMIFAVVIAVGVWTVSYFRYLKDAYDQRFDPPFDQVPIKLWRERQIRWERVNPQVPHIPGLNPEQRYFFRIYFAQLIDRVERRPDHTLIFDDGAYQIVIEGPNEFDPDVDRLLSYATAVDLLVEVDEQGRSRITLSPLTYVAIRAIYVARTQRPWLLSRSGLFWIGVGGAGLAALAVLGAHEAGQAIPVIAMAFPMRPDSLLKVDPLLVSMRRFRMDLDRYLDFLEKNQSLDVSMGNWFTKVRGASIAWDTHTHRLLGHAQYDLSAIRFATFDIRNRLQGLNLQDLSVHQLEMLLKQLRDSSETVLRGMGDPVALPKHPHPIVLIPTPFRPYVEQQRSLKIPGRTFGEVFDHLVQTYPKLRTHFLNEDGSPRRLLQFRIDGAYVIPALMERWRDRPVAHSEIEIVPSIAGGLPDEPSIQEQVYAQLSVDQQKGGAVQLINQAPYETLWRGQPGQLWLFRQDQNAQVRYAVRRPGTQTWEIWDDRLLGLSNISVPWGIRRYSFNGFWLAGLSVLALLSSACATVENSQRLQQAA